MVEDKSNKITLKSTKKEMLDAYKDLVKKLEERREMVLKPEQKAEEQKIRKVVERANGLNLEGINRSVVQLKNEINKTFGTLLEKLESELAKYQDISQAIVAKEKELEEIYEIRKSASSLAALIEAQNQRRKDFELEMEEKKQSLLSEIESTRKQWESEKIRYETELKESKEVEEKRRKREKEEYEYTFKREQQIGRDKFTDEMAKSEKALNDMKQQVENELTERELTVAEREENIVALENRIKELEKAQDEVVKKAIKETTDTLLANYQSKETLMKKEFEGERNVLSARIQSLDETVKRQNEEISKLMRQLEKAATQVQDIAVKAVESSSHLKFIDKFHASMEEKRPREVEVKNKQ